MTAYVPTQFPAWVGLPTTVLADAAGDYEGVAARLSDPDLAASLLTSACDLRTEIERRAANERAGHVLPAPPS